MSLAASKRMLQLMWLASPALPVGGFSYSEGLEAAVESGQVGNEAQAAAWLLDQLHLALARSDLAVVVKALDAWNQVLEDPVQLESITSLNQWVLSTRETAEFRLQTEQMGRSLVQWLQHGDQASDVRISACAVLKPAPTWPVVFALAGALMKASPRELLLAFAFSWAENMVQAAIKAVPLGQLAAQRILQRLTQDIPDTVEHALQMPWDEAQVMTPMLAILSAQHETQYSRLFRS